MGVYKHGCDVMLSVFPEKYLIKAINSLFFRVYIASSKHSEGWENSRKLQSYKPSTASRVCITVSNSPNSPRGAGGGGTSKKRQNHDKLELRFYCESGLERRIQEIFVGDYK